VSAETVCRNCGEDIVWVHDADYERACDGQNGVAEPAEPTSGEPPQGAREFYDEWSTRNAFTETFDLDSGWNKEGMVKFAEAHASECVKRERERCLKIAREYADEKGDLGLEPIKSEFDHGWLRASKSIAAATERGEG